MEITSIHQRTLGEKVHRAPLPDLIAWQFGQGCRAASALFVSEFRWKMFAVMRAIVIENSSPISVAIGVLNSTNKAPAANISHDNRDACLRPQ